MRVSVYDGTGRTVAMTTAAGCAGRNELSVGLPQVTEGVYFYRLETAGAVSAGKFAVVR